MSRPMTRFAIDRSGENYPEPGSAKKTEQMSSKMELSVEKTPAKLYPYQRRDLNIIFEKLDQQDDRQRFLYQLPTGGGKTIIFSEIAKRFIRKYKKKVLILTHRIELCKQTATILKANDIKTKLITSEVKEIPADCCPCFVAMVETLNNRIEDGLMNTDDVGLVIIDEAHHNAFRKLLDKFSEANIIGVTATPLSSDPELPLRESYDELIIGESIGSLIEDGYLAQPIVWRYDVELNSLERGSKGDFTVGTSDELYSSPAMLKLLLDAYEENSKNKKTLIFNTGIFASRAVADHFADAGFAIRHLDTNTSATERAEILAWFKKTNNAILTSVSILTTGFDEPTVKTVILNRATTSLTLYHQMIGRGARCLPKKKRFNIIDLGNNTERFGNWNGPLNWQEIFDHPQAFIEMISIHSNPDAHTIPGDLRAKFPNSTAISFDIQMAHREAVANEQKPIIVLRDSIRQHALMCIENSDSIADAITLTDALDQEIGWRVKQYTKCLGNVTKNYREWLESDYKSRLKLLMQKLMQRGDAQRKIA